VIHDALSLPSNSAARMAYLDDRVSVSRHQCSLFPWSALAAESLKPLRRVRLAIPNPYDAVPRHDGSPTRAIRIIQPRRLFRATLAVIKSAEHTTLLAAL
jgi:hypothetical protein